MQVKTSHMHHVEEARLNTQRQSHDLCKHMSCILSTHYTPQKQACDVFKVVGELEM